MPEPVSDYGRSKLLAEGIHRQWLAGEAARRLVIARPAVIFGQGEGGNFTRLAKALRKGTFVYPGRKDTIKCCGYVGEIVRSMDHAMGLASASSSTTSATREPTRSRRSASPSNASPATSRRAASFRSR